MVKAFKIQYVSVNSTGAHSESLTKQIWDKTHLNEYGVKFTDDLKGQII